jgi:hypothetical protein
MLPFLSIQMLQKAAASCIRTPASAYLPLFQFLQKSSPSGALRGEAKALENLFSKGAIPEEMLPILLPGPTQHTSSILVLVGRYIVGWV